MSSKTAIALVPAVILTGIGIIAGGITPTTAAEGERADVISTVNGTPLTARELAAYTRSRGRNAPPRQALVNELIDRELLYQQALAKGIDKDPNVLAELENGRRTLIANYFIADVLLAKPPSEEEMRKFYQQNIASQYGAEYKTSHILVESEIKAKEVITELDKGAKFADLAKIRSNDPMAQHGGDLGWLGLRQMPEPYAKAVAALEKGKYTKAPVKTEFGWHVILLEDSRTQPPPAYEDIKDQVKTAVQSRMITDYIASLKAKANIQIK